MINRFKSALLNAVSNAGIDSTVNGQSSASDNSSPPVESRTSKSASSGHSSSFSNKNHHRSHNSASKSEGRNSNSSSISNRIRRYDYGRPHFLQLTTQDEVLVSADHVVRPIIVPRDPLPWDSGYAETINSGKSKKNEDQARVHVGSIEVEISMENGAPVANGVEEAIHFKRLQIPYTYFALFDGHAGSGAAVAAATQLHLVIEKKLESIGHHLIADGPFCEKSGRNNGVIYFPTVNVTKDSLIVGALESAFNEMDETIRQENLKYDGVNGGCTVVVCLFLMGKVYIANAGDSRAVLCKKHSPSIPLSEDFTPETERARIRHLASQNPHLLGGEFTSNEYLRRPVRKDVGSQILHRAAHMTGWIYKTATEEDLKFPVVFGHGKKSRVLATIGVTRGFGDHELCVYNSSIRIKPFLSSQPEVKILDLNCHSAADLSDQIIVMGTDGLWDVVSNDVASSILFSSLDQYDESDVTRYRYRYLSAAQDLVMHARGKFGEKGWKMSDGSAATIDDISVFVIPLNGYKEEMNAQDNKGVSTPEDSVKLLSRSSSDEKVITDSSEIEEFNAKSTELTLITSETNENIQEIQPEDEKCEKSNDGLSVKETTCPTGGGSNNSNSSDSNNPNVTENLTGEEISSCSNNEEMNATTAPSKSDPELQNSQK